jgi:hypothetical protein
MHGSRRLMLMRMGSIGSNHCWLGPGRNVLDPPSDLVVSGLRRLAHQKGRLSLISLRLSVREMRYLVRAHAC